MLHAIYSNHIYGFLTMIAFSSIVFCSRNSRIYYKKYVYNINIGNLFICFPLLSYTTHLNTQIPQNTFFLLNINNMLIFPLFYLILHILKQWMSDREREREIWMLFIKRDAEYCSHIFGILFQYSEITIFPVRLASWWKFVPW